MPRALRGDFIAAAYAPHTAEPPLLLLTIEHPSLAYPIRVTSDGVDTVSRGETYHRYPFRIVPPSAGGDAPPRARLEIDNVHRDILASVRRMGSQPADVTFELVLGSSPDVVEISWRGLTLREVSYDALTISGVLLGADLSRAPYPKHRFVPSQFPGLF